MARPRKTATVNGVPLAENLYPDNKGRANHYRYRRPDGSQKHFTAPNVEAANAIAIEANSLRDTAIVKKPGKSQPSREQLGYHIPIYIAYQQRLNPQLSTKQSWKNRKYAMEQLGKHFEALPIGQITWSHISTWWDVLNFNQQKLRHAEFRKLFNWLMSQGLLPRFDYNPFTTADDRPRLILKQQPKKQRLPLSLANFWTLYNKAGEMGYHGLQIAMGISLYTTSRREDICKLRWDANIDNKTMRMIVGKSAAQKGSARATRHAWDLDKHPILAKLIHQARELRLKHRGCPYIISHMPKRRVWNQQKEHLGQITPERLSRMFAEVRDETKLYDGDADRTPFTFHEIRGLSSTLHRIAGHSIDQIQELMAHEGKNTTLGYQNEQELPYKEVDLLLPGKIIGGEF